MDPLHPLVPIQPPPPTPPTYNRVERIQRDPQGDAGPDWQRGSDEESEEEPRQQFEDEYDPNWSDPAAVEPYGSDGAVHDTATAADDPVPEQEWDPRIQPERRARPRDEDDDPGSDPDPGQHIDITA